MENHDYEAGVRDGRLKALEEMLQHHDNRLNSHEKRIASTEKIMFGLLGAILLIELVPTIKGLL